MGQTPRPRKSQSEEDKMSDSSYEFGKVLERLDGLEQQNRRLKRGGMIAAICVGMPILLALGVPRGRSVEAERFVVRDSRGKQRAVLGLETDGTVGLWLQNKDEQMRVALDLFPEGSSDLGLHDKEGNVRAWLKVLQDGSAQLSMNQGNGKPRFLITTGADGDSHLTIYNADMSKALWSAP